MARSDTVTGAPGGAALTLLCERIYGRYRARGISAQAAITETGTAAARLLACDRDEAMRITADIAARPQRPI